MTHVFESLLKSKTLNSTRQKLGLEGAIQRYLRVCMFQVWQWSAKEKCKPHLEGIVYMQNHTLFQPSHQLTNQW